MKKFLLSVVVMTMLSYSCFAQEVVLIECDHGAEGDVIHFVDPEREPALSLDVWEEYNKLLRMKNTIDRDSVIQNGKLIGLPLTADLGESYRTFDIYSKEIAMYRSDHYKKGSKSSYRTLRLLNRWSYLAMSGDVSVEQYLAQIYYMIYNANRNDRSRLYNSLHVGGFYNMPTSDFGLEIVLNMMNLMDENSCPKFLSIPFNVILNYLDKEVKDDIFITYIKAVDEYAESIASDSREYERECDFEREQYNKILTMLKERWKNRALKASRKSRIERMLESRASK